MQLMSRRRAQRLLFAAGVVLIPLPYVIVAQGAVPVARFLWLAAVASAYSAFVDGSGVAWTMSLLLLGHGLVYASLLFGLAWLAVRIVPETRRAGFVAVSIVAGALAAIFVDVYHTPFAAETARTGLLGLFP